MDDKICYWVTTCNIPEGGDAFLRKRAAQEYGSAVKDGCTHFICRITDHNSVHACRPLVEAHQAAGSFAKKTLRAEQARAVLEAFLTGPGPSIARTLPYRQLFRRFDMLSYGSEDAATEEALITACARIVILLDNTDGSDGRAERLLTYAESIHKQIRTIDFTKAPFQKASGSEVIFL